MAGWMDSCGGGGPFVAEPDLAEGLAVRGQRAPIREIELDRNYFSIDADDPGVVGGGLGSQVVLEWWPIMREGGCEYSC